MMNFSQKTMLWVKLVPDDSPNESGEWAELFVKSGLAKEVLRNKYWNKLPIPKNKHVVQVSSVRPQDD